LTTPVVRKATATDQASIQQFLKEEWDPSHVFIKRPDLFEWQHLDQETQTLSFLLLEVDGAIQAVLGYIPYLHWSANVRENRVFLAIWKTSKHCLVAGAGFHLLRQVQKVTDTNFIGAIGVSHSALRVYKRLGYETGFMDHLIIFHPRPPAAFLSGVPTQGVLSSQGTLRKLNLTSEVNLVDAICENTSSPKNADYLIRRYSQHPQYAYDFYLGQIKESRLVIISRAIQVKDSKIARIVDAVGDFSLFPQLAKALCDVVVSEGYEYIDLYSTGLDVQAMVEAGYFPRSKDSEVVVPNYFEPLEMSNVDLSYAWKATDARSHVVLFRGDSDQDRPNK